MASLLSEGSIGTAEERCRWIEANELLKKQDVEALKSEKVQFYSQIAEVNRQMRELRTKLAMCNTIRSTAHSLCEQMNGFVKKELGRIQERSFADDRTGYPGF